MQNDYESAAGLTGSGWCKAPSPIGGSGSWLLVGRCWAPSGASVPPLWGRMRTGRKPGYCSAIVSNRAASGWLGLTRPDDGGADVGHWTLWDRLQFGLLESLAVTRGPQWMATIVETVPMLVTVARC